MKVFDSRLCLAVILPLFAACAGPKPVTQRADPGAELDAIRARANAAAQEIEREKSITQQVPPAAN